LNLIRYIYLSRDLSNIKERNVAKYLPNISEKEHGLNFSEDIDRY